MTARAAISHNLDLVPDAVPQAEPLIAVANLPYTASGMSFRPDKSANPPQDRPRLLVWQTVPRRKTSSGERYDMFAMTAAHPTLPILSYARVTNVSNGESVIVRIKVDRGPHKSRLMTSATPPPTAWATSTAARPRC